MIMNNIFLFAASPKETIGSTVHLTFDKGSRRTKRTKSYTTGQNPKTPLSKRMLKFDESETKRPKRGTAQKTPSSKRMMELDQSETKRPKRDAAPKDLQEKSLRKKLRRSSEKKKPKK